MISFLYVFVLIVFYDQINIFFDYFIFLSLINIILLVGIFNKNYHTNHLLLMVFISVIIDFLTFNYLFTVFFIFLLPIVFINKLLDRYNFSKNIINICSLITSVFIIVTINQNFFNTISYFNIIILLILLSFINALILRLNVFRFR